MALSSKPFSALAVLLLIANRADAFGIIGASSPRRAAIPTKLDMSAGGGMDAYAAQMAAASGASPTEATPPSTDEVAAEMIDSSRERSVAAAATPPPSAAGMGGALDAASAISALEASQVQTVAKIAASIPDLALKPDQCHGPSTTGFSVAGGAVRLSASDAPGPANVAWLSDLCVDGALSSLTAYSGPLTDVPHLASRVVVEGDALRFFLDFRPRAYGAYELRDAEGNYPGPEELGRKSFEYSGARRGFDEKFGTGEVVDFLKGVKGGFEGAVENPGLGDAGLPEAEQLTRGPLAMDVTMPLSAHNVDAIISAREGAASFWLGWALDTTHAHRPGAQVNGQYVYDSKYRINAYGVLLGVYTELYGQSEGEELAAADSGPIDEAYVGGGS